MRNSATVAALVIGVLSACGDGETTPMAVPDASVPDAAVVDGRAAAEDATGLLPFTGRWTGWGFEDPLEAELSVENGVLSGRACGPTFASDPESWLDGPNCAPVEAGWVRDGVVHFDFTLPYSDSDRLVRHFQMVGVVGGHGTIISGAMLLNGGPPAIAETWVFCPNRSKFCRVTEL